jgi:hypothetical protein
MRRLLSLFEKVRLMVDVGLNAAAAIRRIRTGDEERWSD